MGLVSNISSTGATAAVGLVRRLPEPVDGVDVNFCRNPRCAAFGVPPDPYKRPGGSPPAPPGMPRGTVSGAPDELFFQCDVCRTTSRLKNNRAIAEEYRRLERLQAWDPVSPACRTDGCFAMGMSVTDEPGFYQRFGSTAKGDPRWRCKLCGRTFSAGRPARRHKRSDKNKLVFNMLVNGLPLSKVCVIAELTYGDVYRKIDFIHEQVQGFTARRERLGKVDFREAGSRFATDSQTLTINWPTRRERTPVMVQHLCTAHARSGFIVQAGIQFDPSLTMDRVEEMIAAAGDAAEPLSFRRHARVWSRTEFEAYLQRMQAQKGVQTTELYQLPHDGALVRYDILQFAHALRLREMLAGTDAPLVLVMDDDRGLRAAFASAFARAIKAERAEMAVVRFDKGMTNDARNQLVAAGQAALSSLTGKTLTELRALADQDYADLVDTEVATRIIGLDLSKGHIYPFPRKSEPNRQVWLLTDRPGRDYRQSARLLRLATLRSVDSYFHRVRSNLRFAARPSQTPASGGKTWDRYFLYKPAMLAKLVEIYRFHHNWVAPGEDKMTPAMRIGLAKGRIYERDFL